MAYAKTLFKHNFLEYASYVIKERAIPDIDDGFKPVQRRIIHSLLEMDDGKFHKVANVVGHCMKYHPHGDMSIYEALVNLANMDIFIDRQGNFGNFLTGDVASAARYIECRITPFAKRVLHYPELTSYQESYDGRNSEPVSFPAKIPTLLIQGAEGIAVGMATKVLPHNLGEVLDAVACALRGEDFSLFPDFPGGGLVDISGYEDGLGRVLVRAKLNTKDPKRIVVDELPHGVTTEKLIASVEAAAKKGKLKIAGINDFTTDKVNIEIALARNTYSQDVEDALYAFTDCEQSVSVNLLIIRDQMPVQMTVTEAILYHAARLLDILKRELEAERNKLLDRLHAKTLERIFIEERIYKRIEEQSSRKGVFTEVFRGFEPFLKEVGREITEDDIERLLKIPIRRISLYDINKARDEVNEINSRLDKIEYHLAHLVEYALDSVEELKRAGNAEERVRRAEIISFDKTDVREAANRDLTLRYNPANGYLGYGLKNGKEQFKVSLYDRVLVVKKSGTYFVANVSEKLFVDKTMRYCTLADKEVLDTTVLTVIYQDRKTKALYIKRCKITQFILSKTYELVPKEGKLINLSDRDDAEIFLEYKPKPRLKVLEERFFFHDFLIKGVKSNGVRLTAKEVKTLKVRMVRPPQDEEHAVHDEDAAAESQPDVQDNPNLPRQGDLFEEEK